MSTNLSWFCSLQQSALAAKQSDSLFTSLVAVQPDETKGTPNALTVGCGLVGYGVRGRLQTCLGHSLSCSSSDRVSEPTLNFSCFPITGIRILMCTLLID